jgi:manganese transport protein
MKTKRTFFNGQLFRPGPGVFITAAFIGPGTVTTCMRAGVEFGFDLVWLLGFALISTYVLQEMSIRIGIVAKSGLGKVLLHQPYHPVIKWTTIALVLIAIVLGNTVYEGGNITGAAIGLEFLVLQWETSFINYQFIVLFVGMVAALILWTGSIKKLQAVLVIAVIGMSISFIGSWMILGWGGTSFLKGWIPKLPGESGLVAMGLIGTTIVPYNLFLHASLGARKWQHTEDIAIARKDAFWSICIGMLISAAILSVSAQSGLSSVQSIRDMGHILEAGFGHMGVYMISIGIFAAGLSSALTAPYAAGLVIQEAIPLSEKWGELVQKYASIGIVVIGTFTTFWGVKPLQLILTAQVANGVLLPLLVIVLITLCNDKKLLGAYVNSKWQNGIALGIWGVTLLLALKALGLWTF